MDEPFMNPEADAELTRAILARTSGSACQRLRDQACAFVDGELDAAHEGLVGAHLAHCAACASLVAALRTSEAMLPALVQVDPGPWFTQRVMRATAYAPRATAPDLRALWWKLLHRPRIALETAFLGAAASMLGLVMPMPTLPSSLRLPTLVQPLKASAHRVVGQVIQAEQRSTAKLGQALRPRELSASAQPKTLWQRWTFRIHSWWQVLWSCRGNSTPPPNP